MGVIAGPRKKENVPGGIIISKNLNHKWSCSYQVGILQPCVAQCAVDWEQFTMNIAAILWESVRCLVKI